jgi:hypothetical protein
VHDGAFDDAIEANRGFGLDGLLAGHRRERLVEHLVEVAPKLREIDTAGVEQMTRLRVFDERVEEVFEPDEIVAAVGGKPERAANALERLRCKRNRCAAHARCPSGSGSIVTSSGNSCCSARRFVAVTFVSAMSFV